MKGFALIILLTLSFETRAQQFEPIDKQSEIKFTIRNFGVAVEGRLSGLKGVVEWDVHQPIKSHFDVTVDATSIDTGIDLRDKHLKKEEFFHVSRYPAIRLQSIEIFPMAAKDGWMVKAHLGMKGVSKELSFPFTVTPVGRELEMRAEFKLDRRSFGIGSGSLSMSDVVEVTIVARLLPVENTVKSATETIH